MTNKLAEIPYKKEWQEIIRLLHKFCPWSKNLIHELKDLNRDNIETVLSWVNSEWRCSKININKDSHEIFLDFFGDQLEEEKGRVLVIPDLGWNAKKPFVCAAKTLLERLKEGAIVKHNNRKWMYIDGCSDVLFVFETSKKIVFFNHDNGACQVNPKES